jgi:hypothetical protein
MSLTYASASSLNNSVDRLSDLVSYTIPPTPARTAKTIINNSNLVISATGGWPGTAPIAGNALYFAGANNRLGLQGATGSWAATTANATNGGANGKLNFTNLGQYTIETFICWSGSGGVSQEGWYEAGTGGVAIGATSSFLYNAVSGNNYGAQFNYTIARGTWYHIAFTRFNNGSNNIIQCWVNGTQLGTGVELNQNWTGVDPFGSAIAPFIGGGNSSQGFSFTGWMQEYRISNIRRYTANFTPTTVPFVNDANTVLLIHGSSPTTDDNS